jgi:hypothetical protein
MFLPVDLIEVDVLVVDVLELDVLGARPLLYTLISRGIPMHEPGQKSWGEGSKEIFFWWGGGEWGQG